LADCLEGPWTLLLQRLYVPAGGRVLIGGVDIGQIDPAWLRRQIGVLVLISYIGELHSEGCFRTSSTLPPT
jgi:hypothetical protein